MKALNIFGQAIGLVGLFLLARDSWWTLGGVILVVASNNIQQQAVWRRLGS